MEYVKDKKLDSAMLYVRKQLVIAIKNREDITPFTSLMKDLIGEINART